MQLFRLYSGNDQQSHLEELKIPFAPGQVAEQTPLQPATGVIFTRMAPGAFVDWHNAPRRQYVITLAGGVEIGLGDGSLHRFGPGEGNFGRRPHRKGSHDPGSRRRASYYDDRSAERLICSRERKYGAKRSKSTEAIPSPAEPQERTRSSDALRAQKSLLFQTRWRESVCVSNPRSGYADVRPPRRAAPINFLSSRACHFGLGA